MNADITKFLATAKGKRLVKRAHKQVLRQREKEMQHVRLARITNGAHPDYKNGF